MSEMEKKIPPLHPGEVLSEEFLEPMGISSYRHAKEAELSLPVKFAHRLSIDHVHKNGYI